MLSTVYLLNLYVPVDFKILKSKESNGSINSVQKHTKCKQSIKNI